jgi:hypothetical protein
MSQSDAHANRWHPYNAEPAPALWASVLRTSWRDVPSTHQSSIGGNAWHEEPLGPDKREWNDAIWARNRTIVVVGDSLTRFGLEYLCEVSSPDSHPSRHSHRQCA